jgi:hypothetical protein
MAFHSCICHLLHGFFQWQTRNALKIYWAREEKREKHNISARTERPQHHNN